ncbi:MAG: CAP domain-containing protein [Mycobacteriales bacterium]
MFGARVRMGRAVAAAVATGLITAFSAALTLPAHAADDYSLAAAFVADINQARAQAGLPAYAVAGDLSAIAADHSAAMAASQTLYHNPDLTTVVPDWQWVGENVGVGPTVSAINTAFLQSPPHRANILNVHYTQVGVGVVVDSRGAVWVTEDFRQPMAPAPQPTSSAPARPAVPVSMVTHPPVTSSARPPIISVSQPRASGASEKAVRPAAPIHSRPARKKQPAASVQSQLASRVAWLQSHVPSAAAANPLLQAFAYLNALSALSGLSGT